MILSPEQITTRLQAKGQHPAKVLSDLEEQSIKSKTWPKDIALLLEQIVRPAFARSRPQNITAAGRQALNSGQQPLVLPDDEKIIKPWKFEQQYAVGVLDWIVQHSDASILENNWHLITPPVLTLLDDEQTTNKIRGCELLQTLLEKVSPELWTRTGLGKVFEQALLPTLSYLPPLTSQEESVQLLSAVYPTLLAFCQRESSKPEQRNKKLAMLDEMLRSGILGSVSHSREYIVVSMLLLSQLAILVDSMGIHCAKHLKHIVPIVESYMCDPFITSSFDLLVSALRALQSVILNAWPRMEHYSGEIFKGFSICWIHLKSVESSDDSRAVSERLKEIFKLFMVALGDSKVAHEINNLLDTDKELEELRS